MGRKKHNRENKNKYSKQAQSQSSWGLAGNAKAQDINVQPAVDNTKQQNQGRGSSVPKAQDICVQPAADNIKQENLGRGSIPPKNFSKEQPKPAPEKVVQLTDDGFTKDFFWALHRFQKRGLQTDVCLESGNLSVSCHKLVLMAASQYFVDIFDYEDEDNSIIDLDVVDPSILGNLVTYFYTSQINITTSNVEKLAYASKMFSLYSLNASCASFLEGELFVSNCIKYWRLGRHTRMEKLQAAAKNLILANFTAICETKEFLSLDECELVEIIRDDRLNVVPEDGVFTAVMKWLDQYPDGTYLYDKDGLAAEILPHVRLAHCSLLFLHRQVSKHPLLRKDPLLKLVDDAKEYHALQGLETLPPVPPRQPQKLPVTSQKPPVTSQKPPVTSQHLEYLSKGQLLLCKCSNCQTGDFYLSRR